MLNLFGNLKKVFKKSRNWKNDGPDYYISNIWKRALDDTRHALEDGITIYSELVGFTDGGAAIQKGYDYGCEPGKYRNVVYRITYTKSDGSVIEFTWPQIVDYCKKYGLETVKPLFYGTVNELKNKLGIYRGTIMYNRGHEGVEFLTEEGHKQNELDGLFRILQESFNLEQNCTVCANKVPAEGVVVRIDGKEAFKLKSKKFVLHESAEMDAGVEDIEAQQ